MIPLPIETGVPIPEKLKKVKTKFPFADMQPGDSLFFDNPSDKESARAAAHQFLKKRKLRWIFRTLQTKDEGGWRMWRIE